MAEVRNAKVLALVAKEQLPALIERNDRVGLYFFLAHSLLTGVTGTLLWFSLNSFWIIPAMILHGIVLVHWFAPLHECIHGSAFRSNGLNDLVGWIGGLIILIPPPHFKYEHVAHHAYTSDPEKDPERIPQGETFWGYLYYATGIPYFRGVVDTLIRIPFACFSDEERRFIPKRRLKEVQRSTWIMWLVYGLMIIVSIWYQSWAAMIFWLLPRIIGEPLMRLIRMTEHVGCERDSDMLRNTRSVEPSLPSQLLGWNMCFHTAHHALPSVPFHALPRLHGILHDHLGYLSRGYPAAQCELAVNGLRNSGYRGVEFDKR